MAHKLKNPVDILLSWFNTMSVFQQQYLARIFFLCTSQDTSDFALDGEQARFRIKHYISQKDFPIRMISRVLIIRSVFDLILNNIDIFRNIESQMAAAETIMYPEANILINLSERQWEKTANSWRQLRNSRLTDKVFQLWLQAFMR